ncbi:MAG TPA: adenylate kinase [Spirochaetales bacterium]|nr:adenylate kinase [Spirochaetales bacterium]HRY55221.1 adenylate kinase [Spirochaetia bacterium]HRZ63518.1 adenylate kinase [Spirochaetia bacterium]
MKLIFLGPPGAGKGTIADLAAPALGLPHISTGDLFRAAVKDETPLGLKVKGILASGGLVPDELTIALVEERLAAPDARSGWILDGFPRTIPQAEALERLAPADKAVNFEVADEVVIGRLSTRRVCRACGKIYNVRNMRPKQEGVCDACGGEVYTRDDDKESSIKTRLENYRKQTAPLIDWYGSRGKLLTIGGEGGAEAVFAAFRAALGLNK